MKALIDIIYNIKELENPREKVLYNSTKLVNNNNVKSKKIIENANSNKITCDLCNKTVISGEFVTAKQRKNKYM